MVMWNPDPIARTVASLPAGLSSGQVRIIDGRDGAWPLTALKLLEGGVSAVVVDAPELPGTGGAAGAAGILDEVKGRVFLAWPFAASPAVIQAGAPSGALTPGVVGVPGSTAGLLPSGSALLRLTVTAAPRRGLDAVGADTLLTLPGILDVAASPYSAAKLLAGIRVTRRSAHVMTVEGRLSASVTVTGTITGHPVGPHGLRLDVLGAHGDALYEIPDGGAAPARVSFRDARGEFVLPSLWESSLRATVRRACDAVAGDAPASTDLEALASLTDLLSPTGRQ